MILTTTDQIEGRRITDYEGIVAGLPMLMVSASRTAVVVQ